MKTSQAQLSEEILGSIRAALKEDIGLGDVTTNSIVPLDATMKGQIIAKQEGILAGLDVVQAAYHLFDAEVIFDEKVEEGAHVDTGRILAMVSGRARTLLTIERTALNFLGRMSGIATLTRQFVDAVKGTQAVILDTRKTVPGLRAVDKLAVQRGGGQNHRVGLHDMILIKDNHIDFAGGLAEAVRRARASNRDNLANCPTDGLQIEVEARSVDDVRAALELGVERILLDNMSIERMSEAVKLTARRARLEASGNVSLETVRAIAETGVDFISVGALTHSAKVFDVSFDYVEE